MWHFQKFPSSTFSGYHPHKHNDLDRLGNSQNQKYLKGCFITLSGFQGSKRDTLKSIIIKLGAWYEPNFTHKTTHVISKFLSTPKIEKVKECREDATRRVYAVYKNWLEDCEMLCKKCDEMEKKYLICSNLKKTSADSNSSQGGASQELSSRKDGIGQRQKYGDSSGDVASGSKPLEGDDDDGMEDINLDDISTDDDAKILDNPFADALAPNQLQEKAADTLNDHDFDEIEVMEDDLNFQNSDTNKISSENQLKLQGSCFLFSNSIMSSPNFESLIQLIILHGGLNLQDERFFTVENILNFSDKIYYLGKIQEKNTTIDNFIQSYPILCKFSEEGKILNLEVDKILEICS